MKSESENYFTKVVAFFERDFAESKTGIEKWKRKQFYKSTGLFWEGTLKRAKTELKSESENYF